MITARAPTEYVLGGSDAEHERLTRQASVLAPHTQRLFRDAGITSGQRVLDVGCGLGDVALLVSSLVGANGSVLGIDRDTTALARARARAAVAGASNVQFLETDLMDPHIDGVFDAIVGRFILMFLPDPSATLRSLATHLRTGGVMAFQEPSWASFFALAGHLPLQSACGHLVCQAFRRTGARPEMPLTLYQAILHSGLPAPQLRVDLPIADDATGRRWLPELIATLRPKFIELGIDSDPIGDFATLYGRLEAELEHHRSYAPLTGLAGAWSRSI